jgi:signal transduction histidine kinase
MSRKEEQFEKTYLAALRLHLEAPARDGVAAAQALGRTAAATGIGALGMARSHARALRRLAPARYIGNDGGAILRKAEPFLLSALAPLEQSHRTIRRTDNHVRALEDSLRHSTAAQTATTLRLERESARRRRAEDSVAKGVRHYRQLLNRSERTQERLRCMTRRVLWAQEEERKEISRQLHDEIAQILTGINVQLAVLKQASLVSNRGLRQRIARTQRFVEKSVTVVHRFARELRPALLDDLGLIPALRSFLRSLPGRKNLRTRFTADAGVEVMDNAKRTVLYRVAQEALVNAARHAGAKLVTVQIRKRPHAVELMIHDNGRSFDVPRALDAHSGNHLGLLGMRERVDMVGGSLTIESAPGKGTRICAFVPLAKPRRTHSA